MCTRGIEMVLQLCLWASESLREPNPYEKSQCPVHKLHFDGHAVVEAVVILKHSFCPRSTKHLLGMTCWAAVFRWNLHLFSKPLTSWAGRSAFLRSKYRCGWHLLHHTGALLKIWMKLAKREALVTRLVPAGLHPWVSKFCCLWLCTENL